MTTTPESTSSGTSIKALAIRLPNALHAQLSLIAQLRDSTITDEIRQAIDHHITAVKADPTLAGRADGALDDIEREAATRREAIASLFGPGSAAPTAGRPTSRSKRSEAPPTS